MKLFTSSFAVAAQHPKAVAIARGLPKGYAGRVYEALQPTWPMLARAKRSTALVGEEHARRAFNETYLRKLAKLDPNRVAAELGEGAVLLCWESSPDHCHRSVVAQWLCAAGYEVHELTCDELTHLGHATRPRSAEQMSLEFP